MIINVYGDNTRHAYCAEALHNALHVAQYPGQGSPIVAKPYTLALLAAVLLKLPGMRENVAVWDLKETRTGDIYGAPLTEEEFDCLNDDKGILHAIGKLKKTRARPPSAVAVMDTLGWAYMMTLAWPHADLDYATAVRERKIADSLYWLQRAVPVVLLSGERMRVDRHGGLYGLESDVPPSVARQCDAVLYVQGGVGVVEFAHEHTGLTTDTVVTPSEVNYILATTADQGQQKV